MKFGWWTSRIHGVGQCRLLKAHGRQQKRRRPGHPCEHPGRGLAPVAGRGWIPFRDAHNRSCAPDAVVAARLPGVPPTGMGFDGPCRPRSGVLAPWPFTFAALHVLRLVQRSSRARRLSPTRVNLRTDRELRGPHRGGGVVRTCIPIPPRLWTSSPPFPFNCLFGSAATPAALAGRLGVGLADLYEISKDRPSIEIPGRILSSPRSGPLARSSRRAGAGLPWRLHASPLCFRPRRLVRPRRLSPLPVAGMLHPAPIVGFNNFPEVPAFALTPFPLSRFPPSEALFPDDCCQTRLRGPRGDSSPLLRCRSRVHRIPCLHVLGRFRPEPRGLAHSSELCPRVSLPRSTGRCSPGLVHLNQRVAAMTGWLVRQRTSVRTGFRSRPPVPRLPADPTAIRVPKPTHGQTPLF